MLEIKTIIEDVSNHDKFDQKVNDAILAGWELVSRQVVPTPTSAYLYAELESEFDDVEVANDEEAEDDGIGEWQTSRDPAYPYRCSECGCKSNQPTRVCPHCQRLMVNCDDD